MIRPYKDILIILGFVLAITLPFSNKAFHIDDSAWLAVAKDILHNPYQPFHGRASLIDEDLQVFEHLKKTPRSFERLSHPPLFPYFLALIIYLTHSVDERSLHIAFLFFVGLAAAAAYLLAKRFTKHPLFASLLFIATPMFMISAHGLMNDIAMLAFFLMAILAYMKGVDERAAAPLVLSGLFLALAILTRYIAFALIPLLLAYALLRQKKLSWPALLPIIISLIIYGLWEVSNVINYGGMHLPASSKFATAFFASTNFTISRIGENLVADLAALGGVTITPVAILWLHITGRRLRMAVIPGLFVLLFCLVKGFQNYWIFVTYTTAQILLLLFFLVAAISIAMDIFTSGIASIAALLSRKCLTERERHIDEIFLSLWFGGMLLAAVIILPFAATRYLLPLLWPMIILWVRHMEKTIEKWTPRFRQFCVGTVAVTVMTSYVLAYADYKYAGVYRRFAASVGERYRTAGHQLWFVGGDWGLRFYMERENCNYLWSRGVMPRAGDVIIWPAEAMLREVPAALLPSIRQIAVEVYQSQNPIRVMNRKANAGLYSNGQGALPYSFSRAPLEEFVILSVKAPSFFLSNLGTATKEIANHEPVTLSLVAINGDARPAISEYPPGKITYQLVVPPNTRLSFAVALDPTMYQPHLGDGVRFEVAITYEGEEKTLFSKYIDPKSRTGDRKWHTEQVDLSAYGGKEILLTLVTLPGPADNADNDWAYWGDLDLLSN
ncbi:MAG: glycosyltransferase family 39 protein [Acidobacteria bacterium]|nr:glycosyltransferase family 39 protein [Acidobacteriota bacterium]